MPKDQDVESISHPEISVSGDRYDEKTYKTPDYLSTMYIDVKNID